MELHAGNSSNAHCGRELRRSVRAPCSNRALRRRAADETVGVVRSREARARQRRVAIVAHAVPADLWDARLVETLNATGDEAESRAPRFVALVEEQLHAEADAENCDAGVADGLAVWREPSRC